MTSGWDAAHDGGWPARPHGYFGVGAARRRSRVSVIPKFMWYRDIKTLSSLLALCEVNPSMGHRWIHLAKGQWCRILMFSLLLVRSSCWMHSQVDVILDAMTFMWRHWNDITSEQSWFASTGRHPVCHVSWGQKGTKRSATTTFSQHSIIWIILLKPTHTHHKLYSKRRSNIAFFVLTGSFVQ